MSYMTRSWVHAKDRSLELVDIGFARHLRELARPVQIAYVRIMTQHLGDPSGVEFQHHNDQERWAFVLPDASVGGMRIQFFDSFGFSGHQCYATLIDAVQEMVLQGYRIENAGSLDKMSQTLRWNEGIAWMDKVRQLSSAQASA